MNTKFDNRSTLMHLIEKADESDMRQILAFAAGYEAGRISSLREDETQAQASEHNQRNLM